MNKLFDKYLWLLISILLILTTLVVFWPVLNNEFVYYDDDTYVLNNPDVQSGISWHSVQWAFTSDYASNWHPLTWLSHMLDCQLFGVSPAGHHLTNLLFHIANTILLFWVLKRLTGALWPSAFVAAVFALHPLHVESVAWVAERKDVLSTFFWLLTMWAYLRYTEHPKIIRYLLTLILFALGLMAKPMLVTVPFVLLLLDYWPLERLRLGRRNSQRHNVPDIAGEKTILGLVLEKIPFFVISIISSVVTFLIQQSSGAVSSVASLSLKSRISNTIISYVAYIGKMIWPARLAVLYPHPQTGFSAAKVTACALLLMLISIATVYAGRRFKYLIFGWLWYVITLLPVIGLVQVGVQAMADRYMYVPMIGLLIMIGWGANEIADRWKWPKAILVFAAALVISALIPCTRLQLGYWQNSLILFKHTLDVTENNFIMQNNYGNALDDIGRADEAIEHFNKSLAIMGDCPEVQTNLANALTNKGRIDEAIIHYRKAIELKEEQKSDQISQPSFAEAYRNLANALKNEGHFQEAFDYYDKSIKLRPKDAETLHGAGIALAGMNRFDEAIEYYNKALQIEPNNVIAHGQLGLSLAATGKIDEAIEQFRIVLKARPDDVEMHCNTGLLLEQQGKIDQAVSEYRRAIQIDPNCTKAADLLNAASEK